MEFALDVEYVANQASEFTSADSCSVCYSIVTQAFVRGRLLLSSFSLFSSFVCPSLSLVSLSLSFFRSHLAAPLAGRCVSVCVCVCVRSPLVHASQGHSLAAFFLFVFLVLSPSPLSLSRSFPLSVSRLSLSLSFSLSPGGSELSTIHCQTKTVVEWL